MKLLFISKIDLEWFHEKWHYFSSKFDFLEVFLCWRLQFLRRRYAQGFSLLAFNEFGRKKLPRGKWNAMKHIWDGKEGYFVPRQKLFDKMINDKDL